MTSVALDGAPLLGDRTGVGVLVAGLVGALATRGGLDLRAYALSGGRGAGALGAALPAGVRPVGRPMPARALLPLWRHAPLPPVELWTGAVDVVHGTNFVVPPSLRAARVMTVHDLTAVRFPQMCTAATLAYPALVRRALQRGAHAHVTTDAVAAEVRELLGAAPEQVHVVAPGLPPVADVPPRRGTAPYVLALGTIEPRKDLVSLVRAFDLVADEQPDLRLAVAGSRGWGAEALDVALAAARHAGRVDLLGRVDDEERAALLRGAAVLAYPSVYEGFGFPPLEAMSVGVPVVATDVPALREVTGGAAHLVTPGDAEALAAGLLAVLDDPHLVAAGRERAASFTWDRCAAQMADLYREVAP